MSYCRGVHEMFGTGNSNGQRDRHVLYDEGAMWMLLPSKPWTRYLMINLIFSGIAQQSTDLEIAGA